MKKCFPVKAAAGFSYPVSWVLAMVRAFDAVSPMHAAADSQAQADLTAQPLEELLTVEAFGVSKFIQKTTEVPAAVTIVTAAGIGNSQRGLFATRRACRYTGKRGFNRPGVKPHPPAGGWSPHQRLFV